MDDLSPRALCALFFLLTLVPLFLGMVCVELALQHRAMDRKRLETRMSRVLNRSWER